MNDVAVRHGVSWSLWEHLNVSAAFPGLSSLLRVMVLLGDAPAAFIARISPQDDGIIKRGKELRALRPVYLEQQRTLVRVHCTWPAVLQPLVAAYAEPTPGDMWTDWVQWM